MTWQPPNNGWDPPPSGGQGFGRPPIGPAQPSAPQAYRASSGDDQRSVIVLCLSLASLMVMFIGCTACGPLAALSLGLSIPAIVMARRDLAAMERGEMSPAGRDATKVGLIVGIVSTVISVLACLVMLGVMALYGGLIGLSLMNGGY